uniref:Transmembrane 9 superfamily member n=1 Tax=Chlamydomonas euryale TaxID=1486919 RepID=A0A7R9W1U5_9CHLO|mmetsp:Transcript_9333/g.28484  ORF Transcript_9333/g.28484 Transcript_9333/m.28484 type:complete len:248 (+) Transcript_9333:85-828(+)
MSTRAQIVVLLGGLLPSLFAVAAGFREGEFIPAARKAQFHEVRTQWHDLLGSHCPRFGQERLVALPLPRPHLPLEPKVDTYKIQLSFDGDRHVTHWLKVIGPGAPPVPVVHVTLRRAGEDILGVKAQVQIAPISYEHMHKPLVEEWQNASAWPKHLLIKYKFQSEHEVDLDRGIYVLMVMGLTVFFILVMGAAAGSEAKLSKFLHDMTSEAALAFVPTQQAATSEVVVGGGSEPLIPHMYKGAGKGD